MAKWKILVVDDEEVTRNLLTDFFELKDYSVITAANGKKALEILRSESKEDKNFDLIITDISMPEMDGLELVAAINRDYFFIPIIIMTAVGDKDLVLNLLHSGICHYIDKPFIPNEMLKTVEAILERGEVPGAIGKLMTIQREINDLINLEVEKKNEKIKEWIKGGVQHRFNQPLTVLNGNISFLKKIYEKGFIAPDMALQMELIIEEMKRASFCIKDLIDMLCQINTMEPTPYAGEEEILDFEKSCGR